MWNIYDYFDGQYLTWPQSSLVLVFPSEEMAQAFITFNLLDEEHRYGAHLEAEPSVTHFLPKEKPLHELPR